MRKIKSFSKEAILKVTILNKSFGSAIGINQNSEKVIVFNGDLAETTIVDCIKTGRGRNNIILAELAKTHGTEEMLKDLANKHGLIPTSIIKRTNQRHIFDVEGKWVFPKRNIYKICDYLLEYPHLWKQAQLSLTHQRSSIAGAKRFGIYF